MNAREEELVARPLLNLHWPRLAGFVQPLGGEYAARRSLLERLPFPVGYGVELDTYNNAVCGDTTANHIAVDDLTPCSGALPTRPSSSGCTRDARSPWGRRL